MIAVAVMLAGALGAVARFAVDGAVRQRWGRLPWATLFINVTGSFVIGIVAGAVLFHAVPDDLKAVVGTGFCGGYTTFSTAGLETVRLVQQRRSGAALIYAAASLGGSVIGCVAGLLVAWSL